MDAKALTCPECSKEFKKVGKLNRHIREIHQNLKPFKCEECQKEFKRNSHLKRHMVSHSDNPKPFACNIDNCIQKFSNKHHLDRHIKLVHNQDRYRCDLCGYTFMKKKLLQKHISEAHGEISVCFSDNIYMNSSPHHQAPIYNDFLTKKVKTDADHLMEPLEMPELLPEPTPLGFFDNMLEEINPPSYHTYNNSGESYPRKDLYVCFYKECLKAFSTKYNLKVHVKSHHLKVKSFMCGEQECQATFRHKASLKRHYNKAHKLMNMNSTPNTDPNTGSVTTSNVTETSHPHIANHCHECFSAHEDIQIFIDDSEPLRENLSIKLEELRSL